jgi:hypothetical protein
MLRAILNELLLSPSRGLHGRTSVPYENRGFYRHQRGRAAESRQVSGIAA